MFTLGQMDKDSSPSFVENGKYLDAVNIRPYNTENNDVGEVTPVQGNELITYNFSQVGANPRIRVIGSKRDLKRNRIYWMVLGISSTATRAYILYYDYTTRTIETIFNFSNIFLWNFDTQISCIDIYYDDSVGDTILWEDGGEPKKINVKAGFNRFNRFSLNGPWVAGDITFTNFATNPATFALLAVPAEAIATTVTPPTINFNTGAITSSFSWKRIGVSECYPPYLFLSMFTQKPITPYYSPAATYIYEDVGEGSGVSNNIKQKSFQFRYKYVYFDGQESEWSPASEAVFSAEPTSAIFDEGATLVDVEYPNPKRIDVRVPVNLTRATSAFVFTEAPHSMIARVKVAVREVPEDRAPSDWYQFYDITEDEIYGFQINRNPLTSGFPVAGTNGTFFYDWDINSYDASTEFNRVTSITVPYTGNETLIPIDILDSLTLFYQVPKSARSSAIVGNRKFWGGIKEQVPITKETESSLRTLTLTERNSVQEFSIEETTTEINTFNINASSFTSPSPTTVQAVFNTSGAVTASDYGPPFKYDFTITLQFDAQGSSTTFPIVFWQRISGSSAGLSPANNTTLNTFVKEIVEDTITAATATFDASAGTLTVLFTIASPGLIGGTLTSATITNGGGATALGFFRSASFLPIRTIKNHSEQQLGFAFQDQTGRMTPVVSGDWAKLLTGHFVNDSLETLSRSIRVTGLSDIVAPAEATVMHILRKRSESYSDFIQFAISMGNCPTQSWNNVRPYHIGFLNLELDGFGPDSFTTETKSLYISLDAVNGGDGAAYDTLIGGSRFVRGQTEEEVDIQNQLDIARQALASFPTNPVLQGALRPQRTIIEGKIRDLERRLEELRSVDQSARVPFQTFLPRTGDSLRFLYKMDGSGNIDTKYEVTVPVKNYSETWNTIVCDFTELESRDPALATFLQDNLSDGYEARILCELVKKTPTSQDAFYWETAAQLSCKNGDVLSQSNSIDIFGDSYIKLRGYCIKYEGSSAIFQNFPLQDGNYSDFYLSKNSGQGRPNALLRSIRRGDDIYPEIQRDNLIRFSEQSIQETDVRRLGTVYDLNIQEVDNSFGIIEYLDGDGDKIEIYQEDKMSYCYIGRSITTELSGAERIIASQNSSLSDVGYMPFAGGMSKNQASFARVGYRRYFADAKRGTFYRKSLDGIEPISEVGMSGYFKALFARLRQSNITPLARGVVDERVDEYIVTFIYGKPFTVVIRDDFEGAAIIDYPAEVLQQSSSRPFFIGQTVFVDENVSGVFMPERKFVSGATTTSVTINGISKGEGYEIRVEFPVAETFVYSERTKGWTTRLTLYPEWMSDGIQSFHTFRDGQMWFHDIGNTNYNNFFGTQFNSSIQVASNANPQEVKVYKTLGVKTTASPEIAANGIATSEGQNSRIPQASFRNKEGNKTSELYRDSNIDARTGPRLRGRWMTANITLPTDGEKFTAFGVVFNHQESPFTK